MSDGGLVIIELGPANDSDKCGEDTGSTPQELRKRIYELQQEIEELRQANEAKSARIAGLNHEIKDPLNIINAYADILSDGSYGELSEKQKQFVANISQAAEDLRQIVKDFLALAQIEAGSLGLNNQPIDIKATVRQAITLTRTAMGDYPLDVEFEPSPGKSLALADERRVRQVLYNLLSNAAKYSPEGGVVRISVRRNEDQVKVEVADQGIGISEDDRDIVFKEFERGAAARKQADGAGLGLALSRKLVRLHGGKMDYRSKAGEGSTFWFTLPRFVPEDRE